MYVRIQHTYVHRIVPRVSRLVYKPDGKSDGVCLVRLLRMSSCRHGTGVNSRGGARLTASVGMRCRQFFRECLEDCWTNYNVSRLITIYHRNASVRSTSYVQHRPWPLAARDLTKARRGHGGNSSGGMGPDTC